MIHRSAVALAFVLGLLACSFGPPRLDPLTEQDQAGFAGFTCRAIRDGAVIYIGNGETGVIRYRGRRVELARLLRGEPFNPLESLENLTMTSSDGNLELSFTRIVEPPGSDSDDSSTSLTRSVMVSIEDRGRRENDGADLVCRA